MNVCSNLGYVQNKPLKEKIPRKKRKNQEGDEPDGLENHEVEDITQQQQLEQPQPYQPGILDEIDFEPQDGDSSGAAGSFSFNNITRSNITCSNIIEFASLCFFLPQRQKGDLFFGMTFCFSKGMSEWH